MLHSKGNEKEWYSELTNLCQLTEYKIWNYIGTNDFFFGLPFSHYVLRKK